MSTNKRKESAALFELLDKSTLKVPKHAGALKIPSWWSSKTNPPTTAAPESAEVPGQAAAPEANGSPSPPPSQHKLFEPPPADAKSTLSPSIRPPAISAPVQSGIRPAGKGVGASASGEAEKPAQRAIPSPQTPSRRVFAPQSYDQSAMARRPWMGQQKRMMARTPPWAIAAGVAGVVIVVVLIAWIFLHNYRKPTVASTSGVDLGSRRSNSSYSLERGSSQTLTPGDAHLLPAPGSILQRAPTPLGPGPGPDPGEVQTDAPGKVYGPSEVTRDAKLLYVIIASTPEADVAKRNAEFLAQNGVDVSIELLKGPHGNSSLFTLISVKGFPTHTEADAYKKRIVMIGHKTPDFVKTRKAWDDAYATHVKSLATPSK